MRLFHDLIDASPATGTDRAALRYHGEQLSYAQLGELSRRSAQGLAAWGVRKGDRIALFLGNRPELVELALACSRIGAIFIPVSPLLRSRQLTHVLNDSGASTLITSQALARQAAQAVAEAHTVRRLVVLDSTEPTAPIRADLHCLHLDELRSSRAGSTDSSGPRIDRDAAAILYTSGSTGRAKGVVLSHQNLVSGSAVVAEYLGNHAEDRLLAALPLSFDYGLSQVTTSLRVGACAVLSTYSLPAGLIQEVVEERITGLGGVPTMWMHLAGAEWPASTRQHLRYITNSGGALTPTLIDQLAKQLPRTRVYCMYGLTEAFRSTYLHPDELERHKGSIGKAIPNQEILVVRGDGTRCASGEIGELVHRGSLVAMGYWNDPASTAKRFRPLSPHLQGIPTTEFAVWSGDLVRQDEDGFLYFVGRADQLIKTSGYRVSPTEIEEVVAEVKGVIEGVALGLEDEVLGQRVAVAIVGAPDAPADLSEQVRQRCRMQLPNYMVPTDIALLESIPRTVTGKPDRDALARTIASPR